MVIFVDTSAFYPLIDRDDQLHEKAARFWIDALESDEVFVTNNYIVVESVTLIQRRLGIKAVRVFVEDILPVVNIRWVNEAVHSIALSSMLMASKRNLSLVDCVSFEMMRQVGINHAFTFDRHFKQQGFKCLP